MVDQGLTLGVYQRGWMWWIIRNRDGLMMRWEGVVMPEWFARTGNSIVRLRVHWLSRAGVVPRRLNRGHWRRVWLTEVCCGLK